jgi:hypothetical protein
LGSDGSKVAEFGHCLGIIRAADEGYEIKITLLLASLSANGICLGPPPANCNIPSGLAAPDFVLVFGLFIAEILCARVFNEYQPLIQAK